MRKSWFILLLVISTLLSSPDFTQARQLHQTRGWSQPLQLSRDGQAAWFSDILVDATGRIHVAWSGDSLPEYDAVWYTASMDGVSWAPPNDIILSAPWGELTRPSMGVDSHGNMIITHRRRNDLYDAYARVEQAYSGAAWRIGQVLSEKDSPYFSNVLIDSKDRIHLLLTQAVVTEKCVCNRVYYRRTDNGGVSWTPGVEISDPTTGAAKPKMVITQDGTIHAVWESGEGGALGGVSGNVQVMYASSSDDGATWTAPYTFPAAQRGMKIAIGIDGKGQLVVAWLGVPEDKVYYQVSADQGRSWSSPQAIPGVIGQFVTIQDVMSMATDSGGQVHLVFIGNRSDFVQTPGDKLVSSVMHVAWNGTTWSEPEIVSQYRGDVPEWPRIAVGLGNQLNLTWFTRDEINVFGNKELGPAERFGYKVWYSRSVTSAPAVAPIPYPTATPVPTTTPELSSGATQPTAPALADKSMANVDYHNLRTEVDDYGMMLLSGLPVALLFVVGYIVFRRRRT